MNRLNEWINEIKSSLQCVIVVHFVTTVTDGDILTHSGLRNEVCGFCTLRNQTINRLKFYTKLILQNLKVEITFQITLHLLY